jgi:hypothetical protein
MKFQEIVLIILFLLSLVYVGNKFRKMIFAKKSCEAGCSSKCITTDINSIKQKREAI